LSEDFFVSPAPMAYILGRFMVQIIQFTFNVLRTREWL